MRPETMRDSCLHITAPVDRFVSPDSPPLTFGRDRSNDIVLDPTDIAISRRAGCLVFDGGAWRVINDSRSRPLYTVDGTRIRLVLGVGQARSLLSEHASIVVVGSRLTHVIRVEVIGAERRAPQPGPRGTPEMTLVPSLTPNELLAVVALCEGFLLDGPKYAPAPRSYDEAAARLVLARTTLRKRIERVRQKLVDAGVVELEVGDAREGLCEFLLATGVVGRAHLELLPA